MRAVLPDPLALLPPGPFQRLSRLLDGVVPGKPPISLAVGDPGGQVPGFIATALQQDIASFGTYPPITGSPAWRAAAAGWLNRRFALGGALEAEKNLLPLSGTREGLFLAAFSVLGSGVHAPKKNQPIVAMPNPFYQCYAAAALLAGAEPLYAAAGEAQGFLPDYGALPDETLKRLVAVYICSPSNPEGAMADQAYWEKLFALADAYDFTVLADECYADIYFDHPPASALTTRLKQSGGFTRLLSFHSLSKRSGLPGLRSGLVAGGAEEIEKFRALRNVAGPQVSGPIQAASAAAWSDETHVAAGRAAYAEKMAAAQAILGNRMQRPGGGFFLWLKVGDGEKTALELWRREGVRVLPGAYMGRESQPGKTQSNPGFSYIRVALVSDLSTIMTALERLRDFLDRRDSP